MRAKRHWWLWSVIAVVSAQSLSGCTVFGARAEPASAEDCARTAAQTQGWGTAVRQDTFSDPASLANWWVYDGPGHAGNGRRTPRAVTVADGQLIITAEANGDSGGLTPKGGGQMFGRWEICAKSTVAAPTYHSVALLWPDANDWPVGGEIDFMEIVDPSRQRVDFNLHFGADDQRESHSVGVDATQWHSWAVDWTPYRIAVYLDGVQWAESTDPRRFPPRPMHLCLQVDNFGGDTAGGGRQYVDWMRQYPWPTR